MSGSRSKAAQAALGLPDGFKVFSIFPGAGVNQSASRMGVDDKQFYWLENLFRLGDGNYRALWDVGAAFYTAPVGKTIVYFFWYNIGSSIYVAIFLSDGTAVQVAYPTGVQTPISTAAALFYRSATPQLPICCQSGTQYLLIANHNTSNDYWIWDGTTLYGPGTIAPIITGNIIDAGSGYSSVPSYTVFGGSGTGVVLTPVISEGSVVSLTVDNPGSGYLPGETPQVAFSGGGSDTTPILTAVLGPGAIQFLTLVDGGSGYTNGGFALGFSGGGGTGATGTFTVAGGIVTSVTLTAGGSGYTSSPTISFAASSGGTGAAAVSALVGVGVASVTIVNGGTNLTGTPTLRFVGGGGTGAAATASIAGGSISAVSVTNAGSGYTSAPAVEVQAGLNNAAAAILQLMPFGVSGTSIETYQSRVWISYPNEVGQENNGGTFLVSAPNSLTDFATSDGGDIFTNTDRFLRQQYTFLHQTSNFLYAVGDSSTSVVSNVQTGGNPTSTTFSYQNSDPQIGSSWRDTAQDFSNTILFANAFGVYGVYGGSVRKVSGDIDQIFTNAILPPTAGALTPTAAVVNLYSRKAYVLYLTVRDPFTKAPRNVMLLWDQQFWYVASQSPALIFVGTQEINSDIEAWGTDGASLYPLFQNPSTAITKIISTKQWGGAESFLTNMAHSIYIDAIDQTEAQSGITFATASVDAIGLAVPVVNSQTDATLSCPSGVYSFNRALTFAAAGPNGAMYGTRTPDVPGIGLGLTLTSTTADFTLRNLSLGYIPFAGVA